MPVVKLKRPAIRNSGYLNPSRFRSNGGRISLSILS